MPEILFEYIRCGNTVKVTAVEPQSKIEAVVVVPLNMTEKQMQQLALEKLNYILASKGNKDCG